MQSEQIQNADQARINAEVVAHDQIKELMSLIDNAAKMGLIQFTNTYEGFKYKPAALRYVREKGFQVTEDSYDQFTVLTIKW